MLKLIYSKVISILPDVNISRVDQKIFLMFHSIEDELPQKNTIYHMSLIRFKEICRLLDEIRIRAINEYGKSIEFIFTFDDGYLNYFENALPILDKYSFKSIVFIIAEHISDNSGKYINIKVLKYLLNHNGVIVGLHGYSHVDLTSLSDKKLKNELLNLRKVCKNVGLNTSYFSLPYGRANKTVMSKLFENGYLNIFTSDYGFNVSRKNGQSVYPRIDIWSDDDDERIKQKIMRYWKLFFLIESYRAKLYRIND